jgi:hypothetical protein
MERQANAEFFGNTFRPLECRADVTVFVNFMQPIPADRMSGEGEDLAVDAKGSYADVATVLHCCDESVCIVAQDID